MVTASAHTASRFVCSGSSLAEPSTTPSPQLAPCPTKNRTDTSSMFPSSKPLSGPCCTAARSAPTESASWSSPAIARWKRPLATTAADGRLESACSTNVAPSALASANPEEEAPVPRLAQATVARCE
eukprot:scaffold142975_cov151-Phaeocystis_antarctica.AAC.1